MGKTILIAGLLSTGLIGCETLIHEQRQRAAQEEAAAYSARVTAERQAEEQRRMSQAADASRKESERREIAKRAEEAEKKRVEEDRVAKHEESCSRDRPARVSQAKRSIQEFKAWLAAERARLLYFDKHCEIHDSRGTKISRERTSDGVIVRMRAVGEERDVKCDGAPGRPNGITAAWLIDAEDKMNGGIATGQSDACTDSDTKALGTTLSASHQDADALKKILALP